MGCGLWSGGWLGGVERGGMPLLMSAGMVGACGGVLSVQGCSGSGRATVRGRVPVKVRAKPDIHPTYHKNVDVVCDGEVVMQVSGTQASYVVDVYSGNHPFYQDGNVRVLDSEGRLDKFSNRYGGLFALDEESAPKPKAKK